MDMINASLRDLNVHAKKLRREGMVPCAVYGAGEESSRAVQISAVDARQLRRTKRIGSQIYVQVEGKRYLR
jgi:large subunit ribosomal protein L25